MSADRLMSDLGLEELVAGHLARFPESVLSAYDLARVLKLPHPGGNGQHQVKRVLAALEGQGRVVRVTGPADEYDRRLVTRWRMA